MKKFLIGIKAPKNDWTKLSDYYRIAAETAAEMIGDHTGDTWEYNRGGDVINSRHHERRIRISWEFDPQAGYSIMISAGYHGRPAELGFDYIFLSNLKRRIKAEFKTV